ncbi:MAG TPA: M23 family metallopeptidase [Thermoanaerobaculia bacterium]|nr:M23 family metallopeptidase [Thermoanaerobaculia bacterium]
MTRSTARFATAVALSLLVLGTASDSSAQPKEKAKDRGPAKLYRFPGATVSDDALQLGVWFTSFDHGTYARDLAMMSWDKEKKIWTRGRFGSPADTNEGQLVFGQKIYAPADGEVISCWRNAPDNPKPDRALPERDGCDGTCDGCKGKCEKKPDCSCSIPRSGNHINIKLADGSVMLLAHLRSGTIPSGVCPKTGMYVENAEAKTIEGAFYKEIYIPEGSRPKIKRGQFLGQVGNSGASDGPHLHVHLTPCVGCAAIPFPFEEAKRQEVSMDPHEPSDPKKWVPLKAALLPRQKSGEKREIILPDPAPKQN